MIILVIIFLLILFIILYNMIFKRSIISFLVEKGLLFTGIKYKLKKEERINKYINNKKAKNITYKFKSKVKRIESNNHIVYKIYNKTDSLNQKIIYIHGGGYYEDATKYHFKFIDNIVQNTDITIYMPIYEKLPKGNYKDAYKLLLALYSEIDSHDIILMGDSAGGGLALGFYMFLEKSMIKLPKKLVLISPWVDVEMKNEDIKKYIHKDTMLSKEGLIECGRLWANDINTNDFKISPINGEVKYINDLLLITGDREILFPDILLFHKKLKENNIKHKFIVGKNMNHVYPLLPIKEAKKINNIIYSYIKE